MMAITDEKLVTIIDVVANTKNDIQWILVLSPPCIASGCSPVRKRKNIRIIYTVNGFLG